MEDKNTASNRLQKNGKLRRLHKNFVYILFICMQYIIYAKKVELLCYNPLVFLHTKGEL